MEAAAKECKDMCDSLLSLATKLEKQIDTYRLEVITNRNMVDKRIVSILKVAYKVIQKILQLSISYIDCIGNDKFETEKFYKALLAYISIYKTLLRDENETAMLQEHKSTQTDNGILIPAIEYTVSLSNDTKTENSIIVKEEQLSGYDSEETVLLERDTNLNDVAIKPVTFTEDFEDLYFSQITPTKANTSSSEEGSYIFDLNLHAQTANCGPSPNDLSLIIQENVFDDDNTMPYENETPNGNDVETSVSNLKSDDFEKKNEIEIKSDSTTSTQQTEGTIDVNTNLQKDSDNTILDDTSQSPGLLRLYVEHESDFEEDNDYYQLKNDDLRDSDLISSLTESEPDDLFEFSSRKESDQFSETDDSTPDPVIEDSFAEYKRKCVVNVTRLPQKIMNEALSKIDSRTESDCSEDILVKLSREIDRLTDFSTLKNRSAKRNSKDRTSRLIKKRRIPAGEKGTKESEENSTSTSCESFSETENSALEVEQRAPVLDLDDLQYEILKNLSSGLSGSESNDDDGDDYSDSSSENEVVVAKKEKKCDVLAKDKTNEKRRKMAKWKKDRLLQGKLISSESSSDSDIPVFRNYRKKRRLLFSDSEDVNSERPNPDNTIKQEVHIKEENEGKLPRKAESVQSAPLYELTDVLSPSPESNSGVEFVSPKINRIYIDSDGKSLSDDEIQNAEDDAKKGRKNIRKVLADVNLEEATQRANKEEEEHRQRLLKKQKDLETWSQSTQSSQVEGLALDVDEITKKAIITVDPVLTARLKRHQVHGVRFMWDVCYESVSRLRESPGTGCILAHCMGLGKTYQVIVLIHTLFEHAITNTKYALVVCPLSTVLNWVNEFECSLTKVTNKVNVFHLKKQAMNKIKTVKKWRKNGGVLIMGYEAYERLIRSEEENNKEIIEALVDPGPDLIVCDEGHLLKNGKAIRSKALNKVKTRRRIVLTGTPIQNNLKEYYYMVDFVKPKLLGTYKEYCNRFVNPITNGQYHDSTAVDIKIMKKRSHVLHKLLSATVQRYEATELRKHLPRKLDYVIFIRSHPVQAKLYKQYVDNVRSGDLMKGKIFGHYYQLQSILGHPYVLHLKEKSDTSLKKNEQKEVEVIDLEPEIKENEPLPNGWWRNFCPDDFKDNLNYGPKFKVMLKIIDECEKIGDKILIFSNSIAEMNAIEYYLKKRRIENRCWLKDIDYYRLDGTVPPEERNHLCNSFNNPENMKAKVFLMSYKVGGLGLNLVAANRVILMDVNWNPSYETQSIFRIYRFGQEKECTVYRLVAMGTIEEVTYQRSVTKLSIAGRVIDEHQITRHYKSTELQEMLRFNLNLEEARPIQKPPADKLLAKLLLDMESEIFKYHEHQALLENRPDEELNEEEMKLAWDEYHQEQTRAEQMKNMEPILIANNQSNVMLELNKVVETIDLSNPSRMPVEQNEAKKLQLIAKIVSHSKNRTAVVLAENTKGAVFSGGFPSIKTKEYTYILPRNKVINPFRKVNHFDAHQPSTSSGITRNGVQQMEQPWKKAKDVLVLKENNNLQQNNLELGNNKTVVELDQVNNIELIQKMRTEYCKIMNTYERRPKSIPDKRTEVVTPRIKNVFNEVQNPLATSELTVVQPSSGSLNGNQTKVLNFEQNNVISKLSRKSESSLLPRNTGINPPSIDDVIEIL